MNEILKIQWDTGHMNIYIPAFFPCPMTKYKKLLEVIKMDWEHEGEILQAIRDFFQEQIPVQEEIYQKNGRLYWKYQQAEADNRRLVQEKKYPNGVPLTKDEWKAAKERVRFYTSHKNEAKRTALQAKKNKEWFEGRVNDGR